MCLMKLIVFFFDIFMLFVWVVFISGMFRDLFGVVNGSCCFGGLGVMGIDMGVIVVVLGSL